MREPRRHYSDEDRARGLAVYEASGRRIRPAARDAGVPESTMRHWVADANRAAPAELRAVKKEELADVFDRIARKSAALVLKGLDHADTLTITVDDEEKDISGAVALDHLQDLNRVMGTATDKRLLLSGEPTERLDHTSGGQPLRALTDEERAAKTASILALADARRKRGQK